MAKFFEIWEGMSVNIDQIASVESCPQRDGRYNTIINMTASASSQACYHLKEDYASFMKRLAKILNESNNKNLIESNPNLISW